MEPRNAWAPTLASLSLGCLATAVCLNAGREAKASYLWEPQAQITKAFEEDSMVTTTTLLFGDGNPVELHQVFRQFLKPAQSNNGKAAGIYLSVEDTTMGWQAAWDTAWAYREQFTRTPSDTKDWSNDIRMVVDNGDTVHVLYEANFYDPGPPDHFIAYKNNRSTGPGSLWDPNTDPVRVAPPDCEGNSPRPFLDLVNNILHLTYRNFDGQPLGCRSVNDTMSHQVYTQRALADHDTAWAPLTFIRPPMSQRGFSVDSDTTRHFFGWRTVPDVGIGEDERHVLHRWGVPPDSGADWDFTGQEDTIDVFVHPQQGFNERVPESDEPPVLGCSASGDSIYYVWQHYDEPGGPWEVYLSRLDVSDPDTSKWEPPLCPHGPCSPGILISEDDGVDSIEPGVSVAADGTVHVTYHEEVGASRQLYHVYLNDPSDLTKVSPRTLVTEAVTLGGSRSGRDLIAKGTASWTTYTSRVDTTREGFFRHGYEIPNSITNGHAVWNGTVFLDQDFTIAPSGTLTIAAGTTVLAQTPETLPPLDPIEIIVEDHGTLNVNGTEQNPVVFSSTEGAAPGEWGGFVFEYDASVVPGYGFVECLESVASIDHAVIENAEYGIRITGTSGASDGACSPNLDNVRFRNIATTPDGWQRHIYLDRTDVAIPRTGEWNLDSTNVIASNSVLLLKDSSVGTEGKVDLIVSGKLNTTGSGAAGDTVYFRPATITDVADTSAADDWGGITLDNRSVGSVLEHADVGYAANPLFLYYPDAQTTIRNSRIHHFAETGIWVYGTFGSGAVIDSSTIERGLGLNAKLGKTGIDLDVAPEIRVADNHVDLTGLIQNTEFSAAIDVYFGKSFCVTPPSGPDSLVIRRTWIEGPGVISDLGTRAGAKFLWVCGSTNQKILLEENYVEQFVSSGFEFNQTSDIQITCNTVRDCLVAVDLLPDTAPGIPGMRFKDNWFELTGTVGVLVRTRENEKTKLGRNAASATRGDNGLLVEDEDFDYIEEIDTGSGTLNARRNYWFLWDGSTQEFLDDPIDADRIRERIVPNADSVLFQPFHMDNSNPSYCRMSQPVGTGGARAGRRLSHVESDQGRGRRLPGEKPILEQFLTVTGGRYGGVEFVVGVAEGYEGVYTLEIFDVRGRRVALFTLGNLVSRVHRLLWEGRSDAGDTVAAGVYFARLRGPGTTVTRKVILVR